MSLHVRVPVTSSRHPVTITRPLQHSHLQTTDKGRGINAQLQVTSFFVLTKDCCVLHGKSMMLFNVQAQLSTERGGGGQLGGDRGERKPSEAYFDISSLCNSIASCLAAAAGYRRA